MVGLPEFYAQYAWRKLFFGSTALNRFFLRNFSLDTQGYLSHANSAIKADDSDQSLPGPHIPGQRNIRSYVVHQAPKALTGIAKG